MEDNNLSKKKWAFFSFAIVIVAVSTAFASGMFSGENSLSKNIAEQVDPEEIVKTCTVEDHPDAVKLKSLYGRGQYDSSYSGGIYFIDTKQDDNCDHDIEARVSIEELHSRVIDDSIKPGHTYDFKVRPRGKIQPDSDPDRTYEFSEVKE